MREQYEQSYGIFDHELMGESRPMALVAAHPKEDVGEFSALYRAIWRFNHHGIHAKFGLSIDKFLELPHDIVEMIYQIATMETVRKGKVLDDGLRELEKQAGGN